MLKVVGASWVQTRVSSYILAAIAIFGVLVIIFGGEMGSHSGEDGNYSATVFWKKGEGYHMEFWGQGNDLQEIPKGSARGYYRPDLQTTGWSKVEIESNKLFPDWVQAYSAGLLEGALTWQLIHWHWLNTVEKSCTNMLDECKAIRETLKMNSEFVRAKSVQLSEISPYWHQVRLFYAQIDGIETGWKYAVKRSRQAFDIPSEDFLWMNVQSDIVDIARKMNFSLDEASYKLPTVTSALIKVFNTTDMSMHVAHSSSKMYNSMLKMVKKYKLNYHQTGIPNSNLIPGTVMTFSSYPGVIGSQDDMYIITSDASLSPEHMLTVTGTPIANFNQNLWNKTDIESKALTSIKVLAANRLAENGYDWWQHFSTENSGTGIKQWLVLNLSNKQNSDQKKGLLWVVEQIPGKSQGSDQSEKLLNSTYWASYGLPYHDEIREATNALQAEIHDSIYSYVKSPKARMFRQCRYNCSTTEEIFTLIRHGIDPSEEFIGARGDLYPTPIPYGLIDNKIFTGSIGNILDLQLMSGPTYSEKEIKNFEDYLEQKPLKHFILPYQWSTSSIKNIFHFGQPDIWQYPAMKPNWIWL